MVLLVLLIDTLKNEDRDRPIRAEPRNSVEVDVEEWVVHWRAPSRWKMRS
jgi:hypothetical protein